MNKKFNFIVLFVLVIALFSACKEPEIPQIIPVKVSFYDGDTLIESSYKNPDTIYDFPANPQKNGYTFAGWELNGELIPLTQKTYSLPQSSYEYTFKATWNKNSMTVSFYDGATLIESKEILAGAKYTFPTNPTKSDCIFLGWKINDQLIPLDQTTYSHEHSEEGYKYEAIWEHLYLSIDSTGAVTCKDKTVTTVVIPEYVNGIKVTSIAQEGFKECESLTSIIIPDSVTSIGMQAFINCTSLESINIPDSVTEIGLIAFYGCSSLTEITMPDSVTSINSWTFQNCTSLTSITIPDSITSIGNYAFCNCSSLTEITIPDSVNGIGKSAFDGCSSLTEINANPKWTSYFDDQSNIKKWIIPDNVTSIGSLTFQHCTFLTSITIPDSVTSIGDNAFYNCSSLVSITIPDSVTEIGR